MEKSQNSDKNDTHKKEYQWFASKRVILGVLITLVALWLIGTVLGFFDKPKPAEIAKKHDEKTAPASTPGHEAATGAAHKKEAEKRQPPAPHKPTEHVTEHKTAPKNTADTPAHTPPVHTAEKDIAKDAGHAMSSHDAAPVQALKQRPKGVAFVEATIKPLEYELKERFYGWRPNDILDFTDNVNNFQLGVLEVTRRTAQRAWR